MSATLTRWFFGAVLSALSLSTVWAAELVGNSTLWRALLKQDLVYLKETISTHYIYALIPVDAAFNEKLNAAVAQAEDTPITDYAGYRAVLTRFAGTFDDAHVHMSFPYEPVNVEWPQFTVRYLANQYVVADSEIPAVATGAVVSGCDGKQMDRLIDDVAPLLGYHKGLESTHNNLAPRLFIDVKDPLYARPATCRIAGADVELKWVRAPQRKISRLNEAHVPPSEAAASIELFGANAAWLRLSTMYVTTAEEAKQYHEVISHAAELRDKDLIVLDVRHNGGGEYNWFMAVLDALYGEAYTSYYARARLEIDPVMVDDPRSPSGRNGATAQEDSGNPNGSAGDPFNTPADRALDALLDTGKVVERPAANGRKVYALVPDRSTKRPTRPPRNPVKARVYVLTDTGCGSACIAFVDEMKRFPGVVQVGRETFVDSRSGTPEMYTVPSGLSSISLPNMVRENRRRGDNEPQVPTYQFEGDIDDTAAVKRWLEGLASKPPSG